MVFSNNAGEGYVSFYWSFRPRTLVLYPIFLLLAYNPITLIISAIFFLIDTIFSAGSVYFLLWVASLVMLPVLIIVYLVPAAIGSFPVLILPRLWHNNWAVLIKIIAGILVVSISSFFASVGHFLVANLVIYLYGGKLTSYWANIVVNYD